MNTVFVDIDTQIDFLFPAGALHVPGAESLLPSLAKLNRFAAANAIPVISTTCAHTEDDAEFKDWPAHCVVGTAGQQKPADTLLEKRTVVPPEKGDYDIAGAQQIIIQKRELDLFSNPNLSRVLERITPRRAVVYGVVTEYCVRFAALGLLKYAERVELVTDAIQALDNAAARRTIDEFTRGGGILTTVAHATFLPQ